MKRFTKSEIRLYYGYIVKDRFNRIIEKKTNVRAYSFLPRFLELLNGELGVTYGATTKPLTQAVSAIEGNINDWALAVTITPAVSFGASIAYLSAGAPDGVDSYGIQIGKDATPNLSTTNSLYQKYPHGDGIGYFNYKAMQFSPYSYQSGNPTQMIQLQRTFINNSSQNQNVNEVGLAVAKAYFDQVSNTVKRATILIIRDALSSAITVPAGGSLIWTYRIKITVS